MLASPSPLNYSDLDPGIRSVVRWVRSLDFETCDSGDGVSKPADPECVWRVPHVVVTTQQRILISESFRLAVAVNEHFAKQCKGGVVSVEATFFPLTDSAIIIVSGLNDEMLRPLLASGKSLSRHRYCPYCERHLGGQMLRRVRGQCSPSIEGACMRTHYDGGGC